MSLVLRHKPEEIGITLDRAGWVPVRELAEKSSGVLTEKEIRAVVATSDKQRFSLSENGQLVRANQGHSVDVDLGLEPLAPPERLFHGTALRFLDGIKAQGLVSGNRQHVHLSASAETAKAVGQRHGKPVVLQIKSGEMAASGTEFLQSDNGVWLTDNVPTQYLIFPETS